MQDQTGMTTNGRVKRLQQRIALVFLILGLLLCSLSLGAEILGLEFTPGFGVIQMTQLVIGITLLTIGSFLYLRTLHPSGAPRSLQADIGVRLAATGLVFIYASGFADVIGIGTHVEPNFVRPFVGPLQLVGIFLGTISILVGLVLYHTSRRMGRSSSMEFLFTNGGKKEVKQ